MSKLENLAARLAELAGLPARITGAVADGINEEIQSQFASGVNPYGNAWAPLLPQTVKRKGGDARILMRTDELAGNTVARPAQGAGIEITTLGYGGFHQSGTKWMVARTILPDGKALPLAWQRVIARCAAAAFAKARR